MRTQGRVVRRSGDTAWVRVCHGEFCGGCGHHAPTDAIADVEVHDSLGVRVGEKVELESNTGRMLRMMVLVFWVPLLAAGAGGWVGSEYAGAAGVSPTLGATVLAVVGLALAGALVRAVDRSSSPGSNLRILRVVDAEPCHSAAAAEG